MKISCITCGQPIMKSSEHDAYVCRGCEDQDEYAYLDE